PLSRPNPGGFAGLEATIAVEAVWGSTQALVGALDVGESRAGDPLVAGWRPLEDGYGPACVALHSADRKSPIPKCELRPMAIGPSTGSANSSSKPCAPRCGKAPCLAMRTSRNVRHGPSTGVTADGAGRPRYTSSSTTWASGV